MKNLAKKTIAIVAAGIMIVFSGCSNLLGGGDSSQNNEKKYTVSGSINLGSALPSSVASALQSAESSARTATSSFSSASASAVWTVTAKQGETNVTGSVYQVAGVYKYNLELPLSGEWLLHVKMTIGSSVILEGGASLFAVSGMSQVQDVLVSPVTSSGTGSVNLTITDGTASTLISRVSSKAVQNLHAIDSHGGNSVNTGIKEFTNKKAAIVMNNVPAGRYEATLNFEDSAGNILYSCKETITVFSGFTTDTWLGEGSYLKKNVSGDIEFIISDDLIDGYGTQVVQSSPYVFCNYEGTLYMTEDDSAVSSMSSMTSLNYRDSYCFDANGHYYVFSSLGDIISNNEIVNGKSITLSQTYYSNYYIIDSSKNILYSYYKNESQLFLTKYPTLLSEGTESAETTKHCTISLESISVIVSGEETTSSPLPVKCIINDDVIYIIARDSSSETPGSYIYHGTFDDGLTAKTLPASSAVALNFESLEYSELSITDVIYQDGKIYIVFKDYRNLNNENEIRSRGGILVYDCLTNTINPTIIGWTNGHIFNTSNPDTNLTLIDSIKTGVSFNGNVLYNSASYDDPALYTFNSSKSNGPSYCFYAPYDNLSTYFAGPEKIVAIKPKKLVIFDNGRAFYTDADGVLKSKSVRRIVYVDLESLSILDSVDTDVQNASSYPNPGSANCFESVPEEATYYYLPNAAGFQSINVTTSGTYKPSFINQN